MNINSLLKECCNSSETAWKQFIKEFHPLISASVSYICKNDSDDVVQIVYEKLIQDNYKLLSQFDGCYEQFLVYLKNISRNTALSDNRKNSNLNKKSIDLDDFFKNIPDDKTDFIDQFLMDEDLKILNNAVEQLKPEYREIIYFILKGYKHREIAEILNISINTSLTKANRAKDFLQKIIKK